MTRRRRNGGFQTSSINNLLAYPEQHIVESVEIEQLQTDQVALNMTADGAVQRSYTAIQQTEQMLETANDSWSTVATVTRRDSFSRTRNEGDDILMDDDEAEAADNEDSIVTRVRVGED